MDRRYRPKTIPPGQRPLLALAGPCLALALLFVSTFMATAENAAGEQLLAGETPTATGTLSGAPLPSGTATGTPSRASTVSSPPTATSTIAPTSTATGTATPTRTPTATATPTRTPTETAAPTAIPTATTTAAVPTGTTTETVAPVETPTPTSTAVPTVVATEVSAPSATPAVTSTVAPTGTAVETATPTETPTATPTITTPTPTLSPAITSQLPVVSAPGTISADTTWTSGSVYLVSSTTVNAGVTLTIQPGAVIKFSGSGSVGLEVYGTLSARGTAERPIVFTSYRDDAYGGDTNGDGPASSPAGGDWGAILVRSGGRATIEKAAMGYGGNGLPRLSDRVWYRYSGCIQAEGYATLVVRDSTISQGQNGGVSMGGSTASLNILYGTDVPDWAQ